MRGSEVEGGDEGEGKEMTLTQTHRHIPHMNLVHIFE